MGVYSTSQFLGAFFGGLIGGKLLGLYGINGVFLFAASAMLIWLLFALTMKSPCYLSTYVVKLGNIQEQDVLKATVGLTGIRGVAEAVVIPEDQAAYLKVELHALDKEGLLKLSEQYSHKT